MMIKNFDELLEKTKGHPNRVVVPGANNSEALEAISMADAGGLISEGILIGDAAAVKEMALAKKVNLKKFSITHCPDVPAMCETAVKCITDGRADFLVKGSVDSKYYLKAILNKEAGLVQEGGILSHVVVMQLPRYAKMFAIADAAVMISPSLEQKAKIIANTASVLRVLGVAKPKVSIVCPVEKVNEKIPSTLDAAKLAQMSAAGELKDVIVEGPYDVYITFSRELAQEKGVKGGVVPGDADMALMPDLDAGNAVYKSLLFFCENARAAAVIAGAKVPVVLPSRADSPKTKLYSIALAAFLKIYGGK